MYVTWSPLQHHPFTVKTEAQLRSLCPPGHVPLLLRDISRFWQLVIIVEPVEIVLHPTPAFTITEVNAKRSTRHNQILVLSSLWQLALRLRN